MKPRVEEVLRYAGLPPAFEGEAQTAIDSLVQAVQPRFVWRVTGLSFPGQLARRMLAQSSLACTICCTLGAEFDGFLRAVESRDMARAVLMNAAGSAWVECGLDMAQREITERFPELFLTDRFSPGYGDLPLALQKDLCRELDTERRLGVYVTDSLLLNPVKSVTAIVGLCIAPEPMRIRGCEYCLLKDRCKGGRLCEK